MKTPKPSLASVFVRYALFLSALISASAQAQEAYGTTYSIGSPVLSNLWVDPMHGNDANTGNSSNSAVRTVIEAWNRIPSYTPLITTGYRICLMSGDYAEIDIPSYWEGRQGSSNCPVILEAVYGPHSSRFHGSPDVQNSSYIYFINLDIVTDPGHEGGGNTLHLASCDHILVRGCTLNGFDGTENKPQETLKVNQVQYLFVEDCDISGAFWYPVDLMVVEYGHIRGCRIHNAGEWCTLVKGGSAYFTIEENEIYDGNVGGFIAGNGSGFEFLVSPWLHYEVYDIKFVNNVIHNTGTAGMGVNGGYNVLLANNTLYRVGANDHLIEVLQGIRGCDGDVAACLAYQRAGGWGNTNEELQYIPCRNVYIYNNIIYNPSDVTSPWDFSISGPVVPPMDSNVPSPSRADDNLQIRGNLIWNGPSDQPLGIEDPSSGAQPGNPTCNPTQLVAENAINTIKPELVDPEHGDFRAVPGGSVFSVRAYDIPAFPGGDRPSRPASPAGNLVNTLTRNRDGAPRYRAWPVGAYTSGSSMFLKTRLVEGQPRLRFLAEPGYRYQIQVSTNLESWSTLLTTNAIAATNDFADEFIQPQRYYRSMLTK